MLKGTVTVIVLLIMMEKYLLLKKKITFECENHTLVQTKMARIDTLSMTKTAKRKIKSPSWLHIPV